MRVEGISKSITVRKKLESEESEDSEGAKCTLVQLIISDADGMDVPVPKTQGNMRTKEE